MNKYHATRCSQGGVTFDSRAERARWNELLLLQMGNAIQYLRVHPRYTVWTAIAPDGKREKIDYVPDFEYQEDGRLIVEDVKGGRATQTAVFRMKAKMFRCSFPDIELRIVER